MRPAEFTIEPSASALPRCSGATTVEPNRPMAGPSTAEITPESRTIAYTAVMPPRPLAAAYARTKDSTMCRACVTASNGRAGSRSANAPPYGERRITGRAWTMTATPIWVGEPVSVSTSQLTPSTCIPVPVTEIRLPAVSSRKLCCRRATKLGRTAEVRPGPWSVAEHTIEHFADYPVRVRPNVGRCQRAWVQPGRRPSERNHRSSP
jgi:hypothetical protein